MLCEIYTEKGLFADDILSPEAAKKHADQNLPQGEEIVIQQPGWKLWFGIAGEPGLARGGRLPKWPLRKADSNPGLHPIGAPEGKLSYSMRLVPRKEETPAELPPPLYDEADSQQHAGAAIREDRPAHVDAFTSEVAAAAIVNVV